MISDFIAVGIVILLVLLLLLPRRVQYIINGIILLVFGTLPLLNSFGVLSFDIYVFPISHYIIYYTVIIAGKELFKEGLTERNFPLQILSVCLGFIIIVMTSLPVLYKYGAISFEPPQLDIIVDLLIYIFAGFLLVIGVFKTTELH
jgi:hypothetical protein